MDSPTPTKLSVRGCSIGLLRGGSGRPLLFLHGGGGAGQWLPFMADLAARHDVIVPEHPGFGGSDTPDWLDNIHDLAFFYLDLLEQLDLRDVDLVGHSLGGWTAAELAVRSSQRLASLTLIDAAGIHVPGVPQVDTFLVNDEQMVRSLFHDPKLAERMLAFARRPELEDVIPEEPHHHGEAGLAAARLRSELAQMAAPHRCADAADLGRQRPKLYPPAYAQAWQKLIPGAKLAIIPECGHVPHVEQPAAFVAALEGFLAGRRAAA